MGKVRNKKLRTILISGIGVIALTLMTNIAIFKLQELDKPVFFEHYLERPIYGDSNNMIFLHYVTNKNDDKKVINIEFPELEDNNITLRVEPYYGENYHQLKYYNVYQAQITLTPHELDENGHPPFDEDIILDDAIIIFNNGETMTASLGEIRLYNHKRYQRSNALSFDFASSSSDNTSIYRHKVLEPVSIHNISYALMDKTKGIHNLEVESSGKKMRVEDIAYPLNLEKDSRITFSSQFEIKEEDMRKFNYYDIVGVVHFKNQNGIDEYNYIHNIRYEPYFNDKAIKEFLKSKGAL